MRSQTGCGTDAHRRIETPPPQLITEVHQRCRGLLWKNLVIDAAGGAENEGAQFLLEMVTWLWDGL